MRRFRTERWWERRADAYAAILEALHHMKRGLQDDIRSMEEHRPPKENDRQRELNERYRKASDEVHKAVDMSSFILSRESKQILDDLMAGFAKAREDAEVAPGHLDAYTGLSGNLDAIEECLKRLTVSAKKDLRIK